MDQVRKESDIVDIISQYVELKKRGKNHFGFCPFHEERTPSFSVQDEKQFFHCFSCGRGGNVFNFLMELEGLSFPQAVIRTAELAHIPLDGELVQQTIHQGHRKDSFEGQLLEIHKQAQSFYQQVLMQTKIGQEPLQYLLDRGLTRETIEEFGIGFSPPQREATVDYLKGTLKELSEEALKSSGLFSDRDDGQYYDRFSERIIFPIHNTRGEVVAFSGRFIGEEDPDRPVAKYLNSPETKIFNKSNTLFNFHRARPKIRNKEEVFLFEGYMDVIAAHQAGISHGVASMGTSLTEGHIQQLGKLTSKVILAYDGDRAGLEATVRTIELLARYSKLNIEIIPFEAGEDPDDYIQKRGTNAFLDLVNHGRETMIGFFLRYYRKGRNLSNESDLLDYIDLVLEKLTYVSSAIERDLIFRQLEEDYSITENALKTQFDHHLIQKQRQEHQPITPTVAVKPQEIVENRRMIAHPMEDTENILLHRLFHFPSETLNAIATAEDFEFLTESAQLLYILYQDYQEQFPDEDLHHFMDYLKEAPLRERVAKIEWMIIANEFSEVEIFDILNSLKRYELTRKINNIQKKMHQAAREGDVELQNECFNEIILLTQALD